MNCYYLYLFLRFHGKYILKLNPILDFPLYVRLACIQYFTSEKARDSDKEPVCIETSQDMT